jgi:abequosyltransferase
MNNSISFCIPTYNRAKYISETIDSILKQITSEDEIVICDNASTDNTSEILKEYCKRHSNIKYFLWPSNQGADLNYLKTVELATKKYCWFMGSDDVIENNAVEIVRNELVDQHDIYLCSEYLCDLKLKPYKVHYILDKKIGDSLYNLSQESELKKYFSLAQSHSALFGYLSNIIFKRAKWNKINYNDKYTGTLYSHMSILYSFIPLGCELKYIKKPLVYWRSGNDSFGGKGKIKERYLVDINGFTLIKKDFFLKSKEISDEFIGAFRRHHPYTNIAYLRMNVSSKTDWEEIQRKLIEDFNYTPWRISIMKSKFSKLVIKGLFFGYRVKSKIQRLLGILT